MRLIDADKFKDYIKEGLNDNIKEIMKLPYKKRYELFAITEGVLEDIDEQPTVNFLFFKGDTPPSVITNNGIIEIALDNAYIDTDGLLNDTQKRLFEKWENKQSERRKS